MKEMRGGEGGMGERASMSLPLVLVSAPKGFFPDSPGGGFSLTTENKLQCEAPYRGHPTNFSQSRYANLINGHTSL